MNTVGISSNALFGNSAFTSLNLSPYAKLSSTFHFLCWLGYHFVFVYVKTKNYVKRWRSACADVNIGGRK